MAGLRGAFTIPAAVPDLGQCFQFLVLLLIAVFVGRSMIRKCGGRRKRRGVVAAPRQIMLLAEPSPSQSDAEQQSGARSPTSAQSERSDVERGLLAELRERVQGSAAELLAGGDRWLEDFELLRFVRARRTLSECEALFRQAMTWRLRHAQKWEKDGVEGSYGEEHASYISSEASSALDKTHAPDWWTFLRAKLPFTLYGRDRFGLPIAYNAVGAADVKGCAREVGVENLMRYAVLMNDFFLNAARVAAGASGDQKQLGGVVIVDLQGLSFRHFGEVNLFNQVSAVLKILHPERQRRCFVIRAPRVFCALWKFVSHVVDPRTLERLTILGHNDSLEPLFVELGGEQVPDFLGGTSTELSEPRSELIMLGAFDRHKRGESA